MKPGMNCLTPDGRAILAADPVWAAYAIADLRPDLARHCRWHVAPDGGGVALIFSGLQPPILLAAGTTEGVHAALGDAELPDEVFLSVLPSHLPAVKQRFQRIALYEMVRMVFPPGKKLPRLAKSARRLSQVDGKRLTALYQCGGEFAPDAFDPTQLNDGYFFGIEDDNGALAAAGGTHVAFRRQRPLLTNANLNPSSGSCSIDNIISRGVAAIGNIYTRPDRRNLGYAKAVSSSITRALQRDGFNVIVLNVDKHNLVARSLYEKLGFELHCLFFEGLAEKVCGTDDGQSILKKIPKEKA